MTVISITEHNVNQALSVGLQQIKSFGKANPSRNGAVLVAPWPVITTYEDPTARVLFSASRNANPFFHVMESLWMLEGRNDIGFLAHFNKRMKEYSDDGLIQHGAYGHRWRRHFEMDQLDIVADELVRNPHSRRAVLTMWDPRADWAAMAFGDAKDVPCNTQAYFDMHGGKLNMTVTCRSNDLWWGAYGANAVHFSFLLEYMAARVQMPMGVYRQFSNNFHLYTDVVAVEDIDELAQQAREEDRYTYSVGPHQKRPPLTLDMAGYMRRIPLVRRPMAFDFELETFFRYVDDANIPAMLDYPWIEPFFSGVAVPMFAAWDMYKLDGPKTALNFVADIKADDWRIACHDWMERADATRREKARLKELNANAG